MPKTCSISAPSCAYIGGHHHNGSSLWYCTALDRNALPYVGSIYATLQKAALSALHACKNHSPMQETCYMNTATCQNIGD
jgi:hypothetical protein